MRQQTESVQKQSLVTIKIHQNKRRHKRASKTTKDCAGADGA